MINSELKRNRDLKMVGSSDANYQLPVFNFQLVKSWFKIRGDRSLWAIIITLSVLSLWSTYTTSGSVAYTSGSGTFYYLLKQIIILICGFGVFFVFYNVAYKQAYIISKFGLMISVALLIISIFAGKETGGASRWISLFGLTIQPSEIALFMLLIYVAGYISVHYDKMNDIGKFWMPILIIIGGFFVLVFMNGISMSLLLLVSCGGLLFVAGANLKYVFISLIGLVLITGAVYLVKPDMFNRLSTGKGRLEAMSKKGVDLNDLQQIDYSKAAISSGGIIGNMPGKSVMRNRLASSQNDFIYAIIIEEIGLIGGAGIGLLYLIMFFRGVRIGLKSESKFGACVVIGLTFCLTTRAMINMGVAVGLLPVTGQPLPMLSAGGTSTWVTLAMFGLIMNISSKSVGGNKLVADSINESTSAEEFEEL